MAETQSVAETFILFELAGTTYALRSRLIQQMEMIDHITPVPTPGVVERVVLPAARSCPQSTSGSDSTTNTA